MKATTPKQQVVDLLRKYGYSGAVLSGIIGNIQVQTGGTFDYRTKQKGGNGYGLFQFDFLKKYYFEYCEKKGLTDSAESQICFMHNCIYGDQQDIIGFGKAKKLRTAFDSKDVQKCTKAFANIFQNPGTPHMQKRLESAEKHFKEYGK